MFVKIRVYLVPVSLVWVLELPQPNKLFELYLLGWKFFSLHLSDRCIVIFSAMFSVETSSNSIKEFWKEIIDWYTQDYSSFVYILWNLAWNEQRFPRFADAKFKANVDRYDWFTFSAFIQNLKI